MRRSGVLSAFVAAGLAALSPSADAADPTGRFGLISDIHLDPFDPPSLAARLSDTDVRDWPTVFGALTEQAMSPWGSDSNFALMQSAVEAFAREAAGADFAIVPGDLLAHAFEQKAAEALGVAADAPSVREFAIKTTLFVGESLAAALPDRPVFLALGNNDSDCGDYEITPGGGYLAATRDMVRRLAGPDLVAADFDATYAAGGYYAVRHPGRPDTLILVVNDVLWSAKYRDACGTGGEAAAAAMMTWLANALARQKAAGDAVWIVHHIPWGIDPFSTAHSKAATCPARVVPFLRQPYADGYIQLLRTYRDIVQASYSGHVHMDDYRLLIDDAGKALGLQKIPPAISPIYGQNPGFEIVTYDPGTGIPTDFTTWYLANLDTASLAVAGDWQPEYTFTEAYALPQYSAESVARMIGDAEAGGPSADTFRRLYTVSHEPLSEADLPAYLCAIQHQEQADFTTCYCGG
ncbi:Calcineurin-like phosphoesterase [Bauldia litoralis]|uniref:Calcineurin-like phosphoesterase n=1 Tax=Bauldia litoralis TaxID=665467 RepID=A0A1G6E945_9HYPH|nr:Calcineurin-like phosphoesterase [Bauldia litoralis]